MRLLTKMEEFSAFVEARLCDPNFPFHGCADRVLVFPCEVLAKHGEFELCMTEDTTPGTAYMAMVRKSDNCVMAISNNVEPEDVRSQVEFLCASVMILHEYGNGEAAHKCDTTAFEGKPRYHVTPITRIQFVDGNHHSDETKFDTHDAAELMKLFARFVKENNISVYKVSGIERLYVWEPEDK